VPIDPAVQKQVFSRLCGGVTVITARAGTGYAAMTATAVASLSLNPPLVLVAVGRASRMHAALTAADGFAVNILSAGQEEVSRLCAQPGDKDLTPLIETPSRGGSPILRGVLAWADCRKQAVHPGGDHDIFVGEIVEGGHAEGAPLLYFRGQYRRLEGDPPA